MPRSTQEILDNADHLAAIFEGDDVKPDHIRDAAPLRALLTAVQARADVERSIIEAVDEARRQGISWAAIGGYLGTSGEAARQRYGRRAD